MTTSLLRKHSTTMRFAFAVAIHWKTLSRHSFPRGKNYSEQFLDKWTSDLSSLVAGLTPKNGSSYLRFQHVSSRFLEEHNRLKKWDSPSLVFCRAQTPWSPTLWSRGCLPTLHPWSAGTQCFFRLCRVLEIFRCAEKDVGTNGHQWHGAS